MKKLLALVMAAALMTAGGALAEDGREWAQGLSPARPFSYVSECDLSARVGYMMTMPENDTRVPCGIDVLLLYLPRTDLDAMEGMLTVTGADGQTYASCELAGAEIAPMTEGDLDFYGWGSGTAVSMQLDRALEPDGVYSVNIPEGAFRLSGLKTASAALDGGKLWTFSTLPYGISDRTDTFVREARVGDTTTFNVRLGGDAASARLVVDTPLTLKASCGEFLADGEVTLTYMGAGEAGYSLGFYDDDGDYICGVSAVVNVRA